MAELCGRWADHADHIAPRSWWPGVRAGSTRAWRKLRAHVLDRDGMRCQLPVDAAGNYAPADDLDAIAAEQQRRLDPSALPAHPDTPSNLRAACELHNLQRGKRTGETAGAPTTTPRSTWTWPS